MVLVMELAVVERMEKEGTLHSAEKSAGGDGKNPMMTEKQAPLQSAKGASHVVGMTRTRAQRRGENGKHDIFGSVVFLWMGVDLLLHVPRRRRANSDSADDDDEDDGDDERPKNAAAAEESTVEKKTEDGP